MSKGFNRGFSNEKMDKDVLIRLLKYILKRYKWHYVIVLVCLFVSSIAQVASSLFMKSLIDDYIAPLLNVDNPQFKYLFNALVTMAAFYLIGIIANYIYQKILVIISQGTMYDLRNDLFSHMEKLPIKYFDSTPHGDIMSVYTNDIDTLRQVISQSIPQFLASLITILSVLISMIYLSIPLTLITLFMVFIMQVVLKKIMKKSGKYFGLQQKRLGIENGYIEEMMEGIKVVKVFTYEDKAIERFTKINDELANSSYLANRYANILMPIVMNLGNISYVLVTFIGSFLALYNFNGFTLGSLASFLALNKSFNMPLSQVSQQLNALIMAMAGAKRIFTLMDEEVESDHGKITLVKGYYDESNNFIECEKNSNNWYWKHLHQDGSIDYVKLTGDVRFDQVNFGYVENKQVLFDINLYAKPGQKIAFVGATGAGKTTITNLINRFYDINSGTITYDGIDIKLIKKDDLRKSLGIVLQDTHLFTGTIYDNIRYGRPSATDEEVIAAAKLANAHYFIKHLEKGYDTILTRDGSSLSQGQRQLLSIARAALANPPVLILDEATSSIDSRTEKLVQEGMDKLMHGRTTFVIAHRLSTIKNSDVIMVMDQGKIIERGNHDDLIKLKGIYYQLATGKLENA